MLAKPLQLLTSDIYVILIILNNQVRQHFTLISSNLNTGWLLGWLGFNSAFTQT